MTAKKKGPYTEEDIPNPINAYGKSKLLGEQYIANNLSRYFIIRTSWLYSEYGSNFLKTVLKKLVSNQRMGVIASQNGTPTSCRALSKFILHLICNKEKDYGVYHFSATGSTTWYGFAKHIQKRYNLKAHALIQPDNSYRSIASRPKNSVLSTEKVQQIFPNIQKWEVEVDETLKTLMDEKN